MRDKRFISEHRGGELARGDHHRIIRRAIDCPEHVLPLIHEDIDKRLLYALHVAKEWGHENVKTCEAMKASLTAHAVARESSDP